MTFLQPLLLAALPLIGLPIIIHLINRQRHRTIPWAAMMFLLDAKRITRGMAQLRYWLIMAMRMLAIAGLIFAVSRPLASGLLGMAVGGAADTTIIVLDRSASMQQQELQSGRSKQSTAISKLANLFDTLGTGTELVLIENTENRALSIDSARAMTDLPQATATSTTSDIPGMLQTALDYVVANQTGRTDIWVCSDLRSHDWKPDDGRWPTLRSSFERLDGVRFYLLSYAQPAVDNLAVTVSQARIRDSGNVTELILDIHLRADNPTGQTREVPVEFVINGARSVLNVEMPENELALQGHAIELDQSAEIGWGRVEIPSDSNPSDNVSCFVFSDPPPRRSVIVAEDELAAHALQVALTAPVDPTIAFESSTLSPQQVDEINWNEASLIVWQAPVPDDLTSKQLTAFVKSGRPVLFLPPEQTTDREIFGVSWRQWQQAPADQPRTVAVWRGDSNLLQHSLSGQALPLGDLKVFRYCELAGNASPLAQLDQSARLVARATEAPGPAYFCATWPQSTHSTFAQDGVAFYVMVQRALAIGATTQGTARQLAAGTAGARAVTDWESLFDAGEDLLPSTRWTQTAVLQRDDRLVALNRPVSEDLTATLDDNRVAELFGTLQFRQVEDQVSNRGELASEIWRAFLLAMAIALVVEALLCLPDYRRRQDELQADTSPLRPETVNAA